MKSKEKSPETKKCPGCGKDYIPKSDKHLRCADCYTKIGRRSKRKGSQNELQFAKKFQDNFNQAFGSDRNPEPYRIRRTPMSGSLHLDFPADIYFPKKPHYSVLDELHIDNKVAETFHPERWWQEEKDLCNRVGSPFKKVVIVMRKNGDPVDYAFLRWSDLEKLLTEIEGYRREEHHD